MDYNKWGIVMGIIGLVLLLAGPIYVLLYDFFNYQIDYFIVGLTITSLIIISLFFGISALSFGVLSIKKGNRKKTALVLGILYVLLSIPLITITIIALTTEDISGNDPSVQETLEAACNEDYDDCLYNNDESVCSEKKGECLSSFPK